jgi:hypothetical protein
MLGVGSVQDNTARKHIRYQEGAQEISISLHAVVDVDNLGAGKQLHYKTWRDDRADTQLHAGPPVITKSKAALQLQVSTQVLIALHGSEGKYSADSQECMGF